MDALLPVVTDTEMNPLQGRVFFFFKSLFFSALLHFTDCNPPHGVRATGLFWLQDPCVEVNLIKDFPELCQRLQDQQELAVEVLQSALQEEK